MNTVYRYKIKLIPVLVFSAFVGGFVYTFITQGFPTAVLIVGCIFAFLDALVFLYYLSKRLVIDEDGITVCLFWKLGVSGARWEKMEEARNYSGRMFDVSLTPEGASSPGSGMRTLLDRMKLNMIKIIVKNSEPLVIDVGAIVKPEGLRDLIEQRVKFVK